MPIKNRNQLKQYFETGKRPTQSQFGDLIDSCALVNEIPKLSNTKTSILLSCDGSAGGRPVIEITQLENNLGSMSISVRGSQISITFGDFQFNLNKIFISIGALNDTCAFDKVVFSLRESTENTLLFNCMTIETDTRAEEPEIPPFPGEVILEPEAISFELLPIEIRVYE